MKMSDVFGLPLNSQSGGIADLDCADLHEGFSTREKDKAAVRAINNHDKLVEALEAIKQIAGDSNEQNPANFCEELAMEHDQALIEIFNISRALSESIEEANQ